MYVMLVGITFIKHKISKIVTKLYNLYYRGFNKN